MTAQGWLQIALFCAVLTALTPVVGGYMARVFSNERVLLTPVLGPVERLVYRALRTDPAREHREVQRRPAVQNLQPLGVQEFASDRLCLVDIV